MLLAVPQHSSLDIVITIDSQEPRPCRLNRVPVSPSKAFEDVITAFDEIIKTTNVAVNTGLLHILRKYNVDETTFNRLSGERLEGYHRVT